MSFYIHTGIKDLQPIKTVIEMKGKKVISRKDFAGENADAEANEYVQRCLMQDRDFGMEV